MANIEDRKREKKIRPKLKSERMFATGSSASGDTILTSSFNEASRSFANNKYLDNQYLTWTEGAIVYALHRIQEDIEDLHSEVSQSVYTEQISTLSLISTGSMGLVSSSLIPNVDDSHDLGSSTKEWKDLYIDGTAYIDTLDLGTNLSATKIGANTDISNTEYGYLNGVSSNIQTQLNGKLSTSGGTITGRIQETTTAFTDSDSTPDVSGGNKFKTANTRATTITALDGIRDGQEVTIVINDANTDFTHNARGGAGEMRLNGARNWTASAAGDTITFIGMDIDGRGTVVAFEKCRSDNT